MGMLVALGLCGCVSFLLELLFSLLPPDGDEQRRTRIEKKMINEMEVEDFSGLMDP